MKDYTITVFTEHQTGLLSRVVSVFTRRHINIESLTASKSSMPGIHRLTVVVNVEKEMAQKLVAQIEKQVDVVKAFYDDNRKLVYQEIALYKIPTADFLKGNAMEKLVRKHNARILEIEEEYIVIEKTGHPNETEALLKDLQKTGIYEFVRSGRIAVVRPMERLSKYLKSLEEVEE
ncbi:MAG: acetolactate synthase-1/3 small subunit [Paraglaciecola sp.]|jgi:acetolactate synthase-1/3 small subunit